MSPIVVSMFFRAILHAQELLEKAREEYHVLGKREIYSKCRTCRQIMLIKIQVQMKLENRRSIVFKQFQAMICILSVRTFPLLRQRHVNGNPAKQITVFLLRSES